MTHLRVASAGAGDDRDRHPLLHLPDQGQVVPCRPTRHNALRQRQGQPASAQACSLTAGRASAQQHNIDAQPRSQSRFKSANVWLEHVFGNSPAFWPSLSMQLSRISPAPSASHACPHRHPRVNAAQSSQRFSPCP
eukprot:2562529-Rhodomonas_salina.1